MRQQKDKVLDKRTIFTAFGALIFVILFYSAAFTQQLKDPQEDAVQMALVNTVSFYNDQVGKNSSVNTGRSYFSPHSGVQGHQYFINEYWEEGSLIYENRFFENIYLKYDIHRDLLLVEYFNSEGRLSPVQLYSPKVSSFELMGYSFIWLDTDTISNLKTGFYNQMYTTKDVEVLVKRRKEIVKMSEINNVGEKFSIKDRYYIRKNEIYYRVRKKSSILKTLSDRKKEIKSFIKKNNFRFKHEPDKQLVEVVKYYDSLL